MIECSTITRVRVDVERNIVILNFAGTTENNSCEKFRKKTVARTKECNENKGIIHSWLNYVNLPTY